MAESDDAAELLFFDTFSHEQQDINLDLVQFPKPVYITQVRIIPLGARVQADFPGGVRLGATNPSKFEIEFFVNDLGMPGASTFENLGHLEYNQNDCIHLECTEDKIPTDGLVLRGWYSTITLAVYGILTNSMNEPIASPPPPPCEPAGHEEICSITTAGDGRNVNIQEEVTKEEWKEPMTGEVAIAHKTADYERDDMDFGIVRDHYHHSGDEHERRIRKTSHSSERSVSSRNRTHSESNDREYIRTRDRERDRDKSSRDWSRSPEYTRHSRRKRSERSRSDAEEHNKWPRTPPASIDSPTRPRSPDNIEYVDDEMHYKSRPYRRSNESLANVTQETHNLDDDDTPGTPGEQFEPILSDDEIIGDDDSNTATEVTVVDEFEMEIEAAAAIAEPAICVFDPLKMPIAYCETNLHDLYNKELENLKILYKKFETQTKCESLSNFRDAATGVDERESFVYLSEQLINQLAYLAQQYKRRNFVLHKFFKSTDQKYLQQTANILEVSLDFEAACLQPQPAFKIRHIKVGARLAELLSGSSDFVEYILNERQFDPFASLFQLYQQEYMALSIKLMLLKAVYAFLDTKAGIRKFLSNKVNGYQMILEILQQSHLTRTKYALQAIIKKLNLHEALECIRENCTNLFVLTNLTVTNASESYKLIERAIDQLLDALAVDTLSYQQPKRFLPVSKKFEIVPDVVAHRSYANALQAYFNHHLLAESLLLLFSNAEQLPATLLLHSLDLLRAMLRTHVGLDYLVDDCFETTQMLIAVLLGIEEVPVEQVTDCEQQLATKEDDAKLEKLEPKEEANESPQPEKAEETVPQLQEEPTTVNNTKTDDADPAENVKLSSAPISNDEEAPVIVKKHINYRLQKLGIELAYKVQTRYHLDSIISKAACNISATSIELANHLHALYSQTCNAPGREHTVEVLGLNNNLQIFMDLIKKEQRLQTQRQLSAPGTKYKSPVLSYAVDLVDCCVRYCENLDYLIEHGAHILELAKNHESFEPSVSAVLQEMFVYLKPLEAINIFAYDNITPLVEVITRSLEYITTFPGDLIMGLRILRHLAIGASCEAYKCADTEELKHRYVAFQFYSADGVQTLVHILEKLCAYFDQPGLHTPALVSIQGLHCCQIILPTLQILRAMLTFAIQCRDAEFKDLTAIDHLLRTYFLLHYFPETSQATTEVRLAQKEIVQTLLAYTQPDEQDEESLHKSLWTLMIREVLKNIDAPSTFIPGLKVLTELLPLPLPIPLASSVQLKESETQRLITERKLWSAHLHPESEKIAELIETIAPSSFPLLADLMIRVCVQLADLAPNMTLLISKTLCDLLFAEWTNSTGNVAPTQDLARLLHFMSRLTAYASLKSSALSILSGRLWELFQSILTLNEQPIGELTYKCQLYVHRILESFLDSEISLIAPQSTTTAELNLASALPPKELIPRIVEAILTNLFSVDVTHEVSALGVRNIVILTEHDITFYYLSLLLKQKSLEFRQWMHKIVELNESTGTYNSNIESLILLLRSLTQIEDNYEIYATLPTRTFKLTASELANLVDYQKDETSATTTTTTATTTNILQRIRKIIEENKDDANETLLMDVNTLITLLESVDATPNTNEHTDEEMMSEPIIPQTEGIVTQYAARPIFTSFDATTYEAQLTSSYWFNSSNNNNNNTTNMMETPQYESVSCDLNEFANTYVSPDTNLTSDCKRILHLSASPQSNRERTPTAPCFRTRRVEVEPSTGRPEKKIYITPVRGRGFPRPPPSRGDLFRSRPPNTSRPPSLHVDDFLALETCGAQPTGPTGYNKIPPLMRGSRVGRNRGSRLSTSTAYRKPKIIRTSSPSTWNDGGSPHYRSATTEAHFNSDSHYSTPPHFSGRSRGRGGRPRPYLR